MQKNTLFNDFLLRIDKDKGQILHEVSDVRAATDEVNRSKVSQQNGLYGWKYKIFNQFLQEGGS